jgi:high affinity Mn2+ porin
MAGSDRMGRIGNVRPVSRKRRSLEHVLAGAAFGALALGCPAMAADIPLKAPHLRPAFDWSGFYIGGHTGYGRGSSTAVLSDPLPVSIVGSTVSGPIGGVQGGYNVQMPSGLVLGVEADLTFPNYFTSNSIVSTLAGARSDVVEKWDYAGTLRGRLGYANGHWLVYATGGFAFAGERFVNTPDIGTDQVTFIPAHQRADQRHADGDPGDLGAQ